jgi:hypothetical protein
MRIRTNRITVDKIPISANTTMRQPGAQQPDPQQSAAQLPQQPAMQGNGAHP